MNTVSENCNVVTDNLNIMKAGVINYNGDYKCLTLVLTPVVIKLRDRTK